MKKTILLCAVLMLALPLLFVITSKTVNAADDPGIGIPVYPGAKQDPENPPITTPRFKNMHLLTNDSFQKVLEWYSQKLGKFTNAPTDQGSQALWREKTAEGVFRTVTISTINVPAGQVRITMTKGNPKK